VLSLSLFKLILALLYAIKPVIKQDIATKNLVRPSGRRIIELSSRIAKIERSRSVSYALRDESSSASIKKKSHEKELNKL